MQPKYSNFAPVERNISGMIGIQLYSKPYNNL